MNAGIVLEDLTPAQLARQALVLYVDGGMAADDVLDAMEKTYRDELKVEADDAAGIVSDSAVPEGMNIREGSMGVIPS